MRIGSRDAVQVMMTSAARVASATVAATTPPTSEAARAARSGSRPQTRISRGPGRTTRSASTCLRA